MSYLYEKAVHPASGLRLHLNENTAGCSPAVLAALRGLTAESIASYPDYTEAIDAAAGRLGVPASNLLLTNGLDEGIHAASFAAMQPSVASAADVPSSSVASAFRRKASEPEAIVIVPAFDMQAACAEAAGARVIEVPLGANFEFPLDAVLRAITPATRLIFITTPNNPTGLLAPRDAMLAIAAAAPDATVFVDEAYADFSGVTLLGDPAMERHPNLLVGRTFAKAYGLAALRCGALVGAAPLLAPIRRVLPPYSINVAAAVALPAALNDRSYYEWYLEQVRESKGLFYRFFDNAGIPCVRSEANFVLAGFGDRSAQICRDMAARGIYVRDRSNNPGCKGFVRITAGVVAHSAACIEALGEVLCAAQ